jgi:hypothetical protein
MAKFKRFPKDLNFRLRELTIFSLMTIFESLFFSQIIQLPSKVLQWCGVCQKLLR